MISVSGQSQYSDDIKKRYRASACGPVTISVIMNYWFKNAYPLHANDLYKKLGTTPIGLFRFMLVRRLRRILGPDWSVKSSNRIHEVIDELDSVHPVAAKFDKYLTFRFFKKPLYVYHWVVLTGYEIENGEIYLFFHDNGAPRRDSKFQRAAFSRHASVLRFALITPKRTLRLRQDS
ncbi:C39 family peptidase [Domibacillus antri]|uniref:C39 family peptidase n=1 Tax=Domibacillus antri TaxID=1714264 RepID=UPI000A45B6FA|nr:C39 family peptidase [Domibacillus antri]